VTTLSNETYAIYRNNGNGTFTYDDRRHECRPGDAHVLGWGTRFVDYDNDGWKDLFAAQGHVLDTIELTSDHLKYRQPLLLLKNDRGRFARRRRRCAVRALGRPRRGIRRHRQRRRRRHRPGHLRPARVRFSATTSEIGVIGCALQLVGTRSNRDGLGVQVRTTTDGVRNSSR
jgi:hypothetical protein